MSSSIDTCLETLVSLKNEYNQLKTARQLLHHDLRDFLVNRKMFIEDNKGRKRYSTPTHNITFVRESQSRKWVSPADPEVRNIIQESKGKTCSASEIMLTCTEFSLTALDEMLEVGFITKAQYDSVFIDMPQIKKCMVVNGPDGKELFSDVEITNSTEEADAE
ncbi:MAG: hypothetical protein EBU08_19485 [Micrococcales bacterium]|nr:hypothetical protein [Micrococcales bacterium]